MEQVERLSLQYGWNIHLYCQRVDQVQNLQTSSAPQGDNPIIWHKVSELFGPHLVRYLWWLLANHLRRWYEQRFGSSKTELTYSPGVNCFNSDAIVVHIIFHELFSRVGPELGLHQVPLKTWHLVIHRRLYYRLAVLLESIVYRNPRVQLIAVSNLIAQQLKTHFGRTDVTVIHNAVDTVRFAPKERLARRDAARQLYQYSDKDFVLLFIGNDWINKGLIPLLLSLDLLCNLPIRLLVVGADDQRLYQPWLAKAACRDRVRFEAPSAEVLSFYAAADAYVGPSFGDAFGLPIAEAMGCGLPVIASIHAGASEMITDGETGLLLSNPRDSSEIARLIRKLYGNYPLCEEMGLAASKYVRENCNWDRNVSKTRDFLETILRDRRQ